MRKIRQSSLWLAFPILASVLLPTRAPAQTPGAAEIADRIAKTFGVTVLKTREVEEDDKRVLYVTVMNPGGNSNAAFQVTTLEVDPATGALISQYRTTPTGQRDLGPAPREPSYDESGETMRLLSTRGSTR